MNEFRNLQDVEQSLKDSGDFLPHKNSLKVEDVVDGLVEMGNTDKVFVRHDDHLGLKDQLSEELLKTDLNDLEDIDLIENNELREEIEQILDHANTILPLYNRELSEDDIDEINEDKRSRGEPLDD